MVIIEYWLISYKSVYAITARLQNSFATSRILYEVSRLKIQSDKSVSYVELICRNPCSVRWSNITCSSYFLTVIVGEKRSMRKCAKITHPRGNSTRMIRRWPRVTSLPRSFFFPSPVAKRDGSERRNLVKEVGPLVEFPQRLPDFASLEYTHETRVTAHC